MATIDNVTRALQDSGKVWLCAWVKNYENGTQLSEFQLFKTTRSKEPYAWMQVGFTSLDKRVLSMGYTDRIKGHKEIEDLDQLKDLLAR